jgi:hypothetical protein
MGRHARLVVRDLVGDGDTGLGIINGFKQLATDSALREERTVTGIEAKRLLEQFRDLTTCKTVSNACSPEISRPTVN